MSLGTGPQHYSVHTQVRRINMRKGHALLVLPAIVLLAVAVYVTGITDVITARDTPSPPFPEWTIQHSSITPECDWGEALKVKWEVNPSHHSITTIAITRQGTHHTNVTAQDICLGTEGMTCDHKQTFPGQPDLAWGRVELEAEGGVVDLSGECQG
jgi:hypothetical protein